MKSAVLTIALGLITMGNSLAQDTGASTAGDSRHASAAQPVLSAPASSAARQLSKFNKASTFLGAAVVSSEGKNLGKIQDLVFDLGKGELAYAVIALNTSGGASRVVPIPIRALKPDAREQLVLNMSESVLAATEGLQEGNWPGMDVFAVGGPAQAESGSGSSSSEPEK